MKKILSVFLLFALLIAGSMGIISRTARADDAPILVAPAPSGDTALTPEESAAQEALEAAAGKSVIDLGDYYSSEEETLLATRIAKMQNALSIDILVITVDYTPGYGGELEDFTAFLKDYYTNHGYRADGFVYGITSGEGSGGGSYFEFLPFGKMQISSEESEILIDQLHDLLSSGYFYKGAEYFLDQVEAKALGQTITRDTTITTGDTPALSEAAQKELEELKELGGDQLIDLGDFFTPEQEQQLLEKIRQIRSSSNIDVLIVTVREMSGYPDSPAGMEDFVYDFYNANGYKTDGFAFGLKNGGVGNRRYTFLPFGQVLADMRTSEFDVMEEEVVDRLKDGNFYGAASRFLDLVARKAQGKTIKAAPNYGIILGVGVVAAFIVLMSMRAKMKPVREAAHASNYLVPGTFFLRGHNVYFLHKSVTRTERQSSSSGGGGGGGGGSHGGRSGSF